MTGARAPEDGAVPGIALLCDLAADLTAGSALADEVAAIRERLAGSLRVAIAGRVKAGKSTLLNALVRERLAPTDAGECTRIVTWYREGIGYGVRARLRSGGSKEVPFARDEGALTVDLGDVRSDEVERLEVEWPSSALRDLTLIDTPGLASLDAEAGSLTLELLTPGVARPGQADAVIYLMRHLHRGDADFLEAFTDHQLANASPVNAIAILSRADEVGAGRLDAMHSAERIAARYRDDPRVQRLCVTVLAVAGLIAETGLTLRESEFARLRELAALDEETLAQLTLSADRFVLLSVPGIDPEVRRELVARLGMFGLRLALARLRSGAVRNGPELARALVDASGIHALRELLGGHFLGRTRALKARAAVASLRDLGRQLEATDPSAGQRLLARVEEVEATTPVFAQLRLIHLVLARLARFAEGEVDEVMRVTSPGSPTARLGAADGEDARALALAGVDRWRTRAANPLADPATVEAAELLARVYEGIHAEVGH